MHYNFVAYASRSPACQRWRQAFPITSGCFATSQSCATFASYDSSMPRAIIRYSFDGDEGKSIRTEIRKRLMVDGLFTAHGTGSWESAESTSLEAAISRIRWALEYVEEHPHALDHIWIYVDEPAPSD